MTDQTPELRITPAPSLGSVSYEIAYAFRTVIRANLPPLVAPARTEDYSRIDVPMKHYGHLSCGTMDGQLEVVGYALDNRTVLFLNVISTTRTAQEVMKATLQLGQDMSLIPDGRNFGYSLQVPRGDDGKLKTAYQFHDYNIPVIKARQTIAMVKSIGDRSFDKSHRYIMETTLGDAQWSLLGIITEVTGLPVRGEWAQMLWYFAKAGGWIKKCEGEPITFWRVEPSGDLWRTVIQLCVSLGYFTIPEVA